MMTDQKSNGIPNRGAFSSNGTRNRVQLVKPNQVNNVGRTAPNFNPVQPRAQTAAPSAPAPEAASATFTSPPVPTAVPAPSGAQAAAGLQQRLSTQLPTTPSPASLPSTPPSGSDLPDQGLLSTNPAAGATPSPAPAVSQQLEQARAAIRGMTPQEIGALLDELASGSLRGV